MIALACPTLNCGATVALTEGVAGDAAVCPHAFAWRFKHLLRLAKGALLQFGELRVGWLSGTKSVWPEATKERI